MIRASARTTMHSRHNMMMLAGVASKQQRQQHIPIPRLNSINARHPLLVSPHTNNNYSSSPIFNFATRSLLLRLEHGKIIHSTTSIAATTSRRNINASSTIRPLQPLKPINLLNLPNQLKQQQQQQHKLLIQKRNYIFLPSSLNDATKLLRTLLENTPLTNNSHHSKIRLHLKVKLQTRWQDTLLKVRQKLLLRKQMKLEQQQQQQQRIPMANHGKAMKASWNNGKRFLVSHMNAKRRVYARRRLGRQLLARSLNNNNGGGGDGGGGVSSLLGSNVIIDNDISSSTNINGNATIDTTNNDTNNNSTNNSNNNTTWRGITLTEPAQLESWFDSEGYPLTSRDPDTGRFVNPWSSESSNGKNGLYKFLRWKLGGKVGLMNDFIFGRDDKDGGDGVRDDDAATTSKSGPAITATSIATPASAMKGKQAITESKGNNQHSTQSHSTAPFQQSASTSASSNHTTTHEDIIHCKINKLGSDKHHHQSPSSMNAQHGSNNNNETINLTWIGHSTTLVHFPGNFTILTDPHFSNNAGPLIGPFVRRHVPPALSVAELPQVVDAVLISHDHYDHLDYWSILQLVDSKKIKYWIVPLGMKVWLMDQAGVSPEDIIELEWWEGVRISKSTTGEASSEESESQHILPEVEGLVRAFDKSAPGSGSSERTTREQSTASFDKNEMIITCAPAQHWCSRTPFDRNRRLWCSWAVHSTPAKRQSPSAGNCLHSQTHSFYFAGDTGLPSDFPLHHQIGDRLGPFDLAAIPIGAYKPEWFMREAHCNPAEAVKIHQAVKARKSVAIHFDTFDLADEAREEPAQLLLDEVGRVNEEIVKMAAEVVAVADEVGIVTTGLGAVVGGGEDVMLSDPILLSSTPVVEQAIVVAEVGEKLVEMLPPLVDFSVVEQGQSIESIPQTVYATAIN